MKPTLNALPCRERPAWRLSYQPEDCTSLEVLAALIGGSRQFELAQSVLGRLGSIDALARADPNDLLGVEGIGPVTAARLLAAKELGKRIATHHNGDRPVIKSPEDAAALLMPWMQDLEQERLVLLLLDTRHALLGGPIELYKGSLNTSLIRVGEVFRAGIRANAAAILAAHNHPSNDPTPSPEDVSLTKAMVEAGRLVDIDLLDHLIIGHGRYVSLKARGLGFS